MRDASSTETARDVILVGGSQGSVVAIKKLLARLPPELPAAIAITIHRSPTFASRLSEVFASNSVLPVCEPAQGQPLEPGTVYLAPRDHHMLLRAGAAWLDRGPKQHHARPAVDAMFVSGAESYGSRVIGVILTGNLSDGVAGLIAVKKGGGISLTQDPAEAEAPSMPLHALAYDDVDAIFELDRLSSLLVRLVEGAGVARAIAEKVARQPTSAWRRGHGAGA